MDFRHLKPVYEEEGVIKDAYNVGVDALQGVGHAARGLAGVAGLIPGVHYLADPAAEAIGRGTEWVGEKLHTQQWQDEERQMREAIAAAGAAGGLEGNLAGAGEALSWLANNPRHAFGAAASSVPQMIAGGWLGKGAQAAKLGLGMGAMAPATAAAIGEGTLAGGAVAADIAGHPGTEFADRYWGVPAGMLTGGISRGASALLPGVGDIDEAFVHGLRRNTERALAEAKPLNLLTAIPAAMGREGFIEELPQSIGEAAFTNIGTGAPWDQGLGAAGAEGAVAGALFGIGGGIRGMRQEGARRGLVSGLQQEGYVGDDTSPRNLLAGLENRDYDRYLQPMRDEATAYNTLHDIDQGATLTAPVEPTGPSNYQAFLDQQFGIPRGLGTGIVQTSTGALDREDNGYTFDPKLRNEAMSTYAGGSGTRASFDNGLERELTNEEFAILQQTGELPPYNPKAATPKAPPAPKALKPERQQKLDAAMAELEQMGVEAPVLQQASVMAHNNKLGDLQKLVREQRAVTAAKAEPKPETVEQTLQRKANEKATQAQQGQPPVQAVQQAAPEGAVPSVTGDNVLASIRDKLTAKQQPVFDHLVSAAQNSEMDTVFDAEGKFKYQEIGDKLGIARGSAKSFIDGTAKAIAEHFGMTVEGVKQMLRARAVANRNVEVSAVDTVGMRPDQQPQVLDHAELFGSESGAEQSMAIINSVGGSQMVEGGIGGNEMPVNYVDSVTPDDKAFGHAQFEERDLFQDALNSPEAQHAVNDWEDFRETEFQNQVPSIFDLSPRDQAGWVLEYERLIKEGKTSNGEMLAAMKLHLQEADNAANTRTKGQARPDAVAGVQGQTEPSGGRVGETTSLPAESKPAAAPETPPAAKGQKRVAKKSELEQQQQAVLDSAREAHEADVAAEKAQAEQEHADLVAKSKEGLGERQQGHVDKWAAQLKSGQMDRATFDRKVEELKSSGIKYSEDAAPQETEDSFLVKVWRALAQTKDFFRYGQASMNFGSTTLQEELDNTAPGFKLATKDYGKEVTPYDMKAHNKKHTIKNPDGGHATVFENTRTKELWLNVEPLKSGEGRGSALYDAVHNYALTNGLKLVGDQEGVSDHAIIRRTEMQIASMLKHGTADHIQPAREQVNPHLPEFQNTIDDPSNHNPRFLKKLVGTGLWKGTFEEKLANLLKVSYKNVTAFVPEIEDYSFDFTTGKFFGPDGEPATADDFERLLRTANERSKSSRESASSSGRLPFGVTSLERAIVTASALRVQDQGGRSGVLLRLAGELQTAGVTDSNDKPHSLSYSEGNQGKGTTAATLRSTLSKLFFSPARLNDLVTVYATQADAYKATGNAAFSEGKSKKRGFTTPDGKVGLIAENIPAGKELGVALHEIGVHLGMEKLIGAGNMQWLADRINTWRLKNDGSVESRVAQWAYDKALSSSSGTEHTQEELIAYMVEGLANEGITPQALGASQAHQWMRKLVAALKSALRKIGFKNPDAFTSQNLIDLAYGAAELELHGTWHGTAADFRNFNHEYMGAGEGVQAFGWGTYLAQKVGIAHAYWRADVERKAEGDQRYFIDGKEIPSPWKPNGAALPKSALTAEQIAVLEIETGFGNGNPVAAWDAIKGNLHGLIPSPKMSKAWGLMRDIAKGKIRYVVDSSPVEKPEGSLMRVLPNVQDHELLDWDKPLSDQSNVLELVKALNVEERLIPERLLPSDPDYVAHFMINYARDGTTGRDLYHALSGVGSDKTASAFLDSIGIKGIKFLDANSRRGGLGKPQTRNLVIFNDKNIHRVSTQVGARRDSGSIKFSEATLPAEVAKNTQSDLNEIWKRVKVEARDLGKKALHKIVFLHDLVGIAQKEGLTSAKGFAELLGQRDQIRNRIETRVDEIMMRAIKLKDRKAAEQFLRDSTLAEKWGYADNPHKAPVDPKLAAQFNALSKDAQQVVRDIFQVGEDHYNRIKTLVNAETNREYDAAIKRAKKPETKAELEKERQRILKRNNKLFPKLQGPYAPLKRFGDHVVVAMSKEYAQAVKDGNKSEQQRLIDLNAGVPHYLVEFYESASMADARKRQIESYYPNGRVEAKTKQQNYAKTDELPWAGIAKIKAAAEDAEISGPMQKLITDLYLRSLAENSAKKSQLGRKGVEGAADMFRSFASHGLSSAHFISGLEKSGEISRKMTEMKGEAADKGDNTNRVYNEIASRYAHMLEYKDTPMADKMLAASSFWMLLTSPSYYITNATQVAMVTQPYLAGRYGAAKSASVIVQAYKDVAKFIKHIGHDVDFDHKDLPLTDAERQMLKDLRDSGKLDITIASDLGRWADGKMEDSHAGKVMYWLRGAASKVEAINRVTTALAAYRLSGSTEYAGEVVDRTQGNYAASNAPNFFSASGAHKVIMQFRKYQLIQISLIGKLFHDAAFNKQERAVAMRALAWVFAQQMVFTGVRGLPIPAIALMFMALGGGDDDKDWERNLRKAIGDDDLALLLTRGVPAALGLDVSGRIGMGNAFSIMPMTDLDLSKQGYKDMVFGMTGAFVSGVGGSMMDGIDKMQNGRYYEGVETMAPRGFRDALRGIRLANEGDKDKTGATLLAEDEIEFMAGFMQAMGLPTTAVTEFKNKRGDIIELNKHFSAREDKLKQAYADDRSQLPELREEWQEVQEAKKRWLEHMTQERGTNAKALRDVKPSPLSELLKYPQTRQRREAEWQKPANM